MFAINGFGRIGRSVLRAFFESGMYRTHKIAAVNTGFGTLEENIHLFKYDSIAGPFIDVDIIDNAHAIIKGVKVHFFSEPKIEKIDWKKLGAKYVLECTGAFASKAASFAHIKSGAKGVIISAPSQDEVDATIVYGVNHHTIPKDFTVISLGSCTTNCLAPIAKILHDKLGIEAGYMTTIHAYTNDQNLVDGLHKDMQRARAAGLSMIPSSTGAAKALGLVIPALQGKLDGSALRVPVPNVSMVDLSFRAERNTSIAEVNQIVSDYAKEIPKVLALNYEKLVSIDFNHNPYSSIFDTTETKVIGGNFVRVVSWYDNEWGFSNRALDVLRYLVPS